MESDSAFLSTRSSRRTLIAGAAAAPLLAAGVDVARAGAGNAELDYTPVRQEAGAKTLVFSTASPWGGYNQLKPTLAYGAATALPAMLTHSRLTDLDKSGNAQPNVAERWEISDDATTYTYYMRKDVTFHDGSPLTSNDVAATVKLYMMKAANINPTYWLNYLKGAQDYYDGTADEIAGLTVIDDYTVQFTLAEPAAGWDTSSVCVMNILPAHIYDNFAPEDLVEEYAPIWFTPEANLGSGPFKYVGAEKDQYIQLEANPDYFQGAPKLDGILFKNVGAEDTKFVALEKGEIQVLPLEANYLEQAQSLDSIDLVEIPLRYIRVLKINYQKDVLSDKRVRQAIAYAIDRQALIDELYLGLGVPYNSFVESDAWLASGLNDYAYDPEKAKQLLADAGWDSNTEIVINYYYKDSLTRDLFAVIQQYLSEVGIKARIELLESAAQNAKVADCDFDIGYYGFGFNDNPDEYSAILTCTDGCTTYFCNDRVLELMKQGRETSDVAARKAAYDEAQLIVNEEVPLIPLFKFVGLLGMSKKLTGFDENAQWMMFNDSNATYFDATAWDITA